MNTLVRVTAVALLLPAIGARASDPPQLRRGAIVFRERCAACHRADGGGGRVPARFGALSVLTAPPLVGAEALGFATAADLVAYVRTDMPRDAPRTLSEADALAVAALLLAWAGLPADARPLTLESARGIRFVGGAPIAAPPTGGSLPASPSGARWRRP